MLYTVRMSTLLLSLPIKGMLWTMILFSICFIGIHVILLTRLGWVYQQQSKTNTEKQKEPMEEKKAPPEKQAEPIYYIVERKTRRKPTYSEAKPINFQRQK